jgi:hypothetical protein
METPRKQVPGGGIEPSTRGFSMRSSASGFARHFLHGIAERGLR